MIGVAAFVELVGIELRAACRTGTLSFAVVVEPAVLAVVLGALFSGGPGARVAILGAGMMGAWTSVLFHSAAGLHTDRRLGTFEPVVATATPLALTVASRAVAAACFGLGSVGVALAVGQLLLGLSVAPVQPWRFTAGVLVFLLGLAAVGVLLPAVFVLYPHATALANLAYYPAFVLSGLIVPAAVLPGPLHAVSLVLPPSWGVRLMQQGLTGAGEESVPAHLAGGAAVSLAVLATGWWLIRRLLATAMRREGLGLS